MAYLWAISVFILFAILNPANTEASSQPESEIKIKSENSSMTESIKEMADFNKLKETVRENINFPPDPGKIPLPSFALDRASTTFASINEKIKDEAGIDFAKFFSWLVKMGKTLFQMFLNLAESLSETIRKRNE